MVYITEKVISKEEFDDKVYDACRALWECGIKPDFYEKWLNDHNKWIDEQSMRDIKLSLEIW